MEVKEFTIDKVIYLITRFVLWELLKKFHILYSDSDIIQLQIHIAGKHEVDILLIVVKLDRIQRRNRLNLLQVDFHYLHKIARYIL